jgi:hypothetical protein
MIPPPPVDPRRAAEVVTQLRRLFAEQLPEWPRPGQEAWPAGDPGAALAEIYAHLAELTIDRLNRAPDKHFLAFLEMIGVTLLPPVEARAPVQFFLAAGATADALVRRETPLATAGTPPVTFETERDLWVTRARLQRAITYDPRRDRFTDHQPALHAASGLQSATPLPVFVGSQLLPHHLYLAHEQVLLGQRPTRVSLSLDLEGVAGPDPTLSLLSALSHWVKVEGTARQLTAGTTVLGVPLQGTVTADGDSLFGDGTTFSLDLDEGDVVLLPFRGLFTVVEVPSNTSVRLNPFPPTSDEPTSVMRVHAVRLAGVVTGGFFLGRTLSGTGTRFQGQLERGQTVFIPGVGASKVDAISSDTSLTLDRRMIVLGPRPLWRLIGTLPAAVSAVTELEDVAGAQSWPLAGRTARWLWATVEQPLLGPLRQLPAARGVRLAAMNVAPGGPDRALAGTAAIDLVKGAFPFGERPRHGDTFHLASGDVLARTGAWVTLKTEVAFPANQALPPGQVTLTWEYFDGQDWQLLGTSSQPFVEAPQPFDLVDESSAFTAPGSHDIRFRCPPVAPTEVAGRAGVWIRVRITGGDYGKDAVLTPNIARPVTLADWTYTPPSYRPPFLSNLSLSFEHSTALPAESIFVRNGFDLAEIPPAAASGPGQPFLPFPPPEDIAPALALGWDRAFANRPVSLYAAVSEPGDPPAGAEISWQYWNGGRWSRLGLIRDETRGLLEPGTIEALGPLDLARSDQLGGDLFWVRAQLARGPAPAFVLTALLPSTTWARHATTARDELIGSGNGKPGQTFAATRTPLLAGQMLEVRELEVPPADELAALVAEGGRDPVRLVLDGAGRPREIWVRWREVDHFHLSGPSSRHYLVDRAGGRFIMGDGRRGRIPPPGRDNVRLAEYRAGGGLAGNVPAGAITVLKRAIPSVDRVSNPLPAGGGADLEDLESVKERGPLSLRHRQRAVTAEDYEALARQASRQVVRARCLPARDAASAGKVAVLIVPRGGARPVPTPGLLRRVRDYLDARRLPTADLTLLGPRYVEVSVSAAFVPTSFDDVDLIRQRVADVLTAWLHPLTGGPEGRGWAFGRDVYLSEVAATLEAVAGVDHLTQLTLSGRDEAGADRTRDGGRRVEVADQAGELAASGTHSITLAT